MLFCLIFFPFFQWAAAQSFDLYEPSANKKVPIIVYVHGGAWISGYKQQYAKRGSHDCLLQIWPSYKEAFINAEFGANADLTIASPTRIKIKSKAPWLTVHSAKDELVDLAQSTDFFKHLIAEGHTAEYAQIRFESHFGIIDSLGQSKSKTLQKILLFIQQ